MATIKSYTDISQSKKLAEILPLESADMEYLTIKETGALVAIVPFVKDDSEVKDSAYSYTYDRIFCWSLAALLDIIPYPTLGKHADETWSCASWIEKVNPYFVEGCDSPINACYEMILKLHELNLL